MALSLMVGLLVIVVMGIVGAIGYAVDKSGDIGQKDGKPRR